MKKIAIGCISVLVLNVGLLGCGASGGNAPLKTAKANFIFVDDLIKNADALKNKQIHVKGVFMGWQGRCTTPPPETRSDWMLQYNHDCIYVSGSTPQGIDRGPRSKDIGRAVQVNGRVLFDKNGVVYIKSQ